MKIFRLLTVILTVCAISSCSTEDDSENNTETIADSLLKQISWNDGTNDTYYYDTQNRLKLIVENRFPITDNSENDSTYIEYSGGNISKILERDISGNEVYNIEQKFNVSNSASKSGTYKIFKDDGINLIDYTFEYIIDGNLLKNYIEFYSNGNKRYQQNFSHNSDGNLTKWDVIWYDTDNNIEEANYSTITKWDSGKQVTEKLFVWDAVSLPGYVLSKNNCLNLVNEEGKEFNYSFEYDTNGFVTKYNLETGSFFELEYYN